MSKAKPVPTPTHSPIPHPVQTVIYENHVHYPGVVMFFMVVVLILTAVALLYWLFSLRRNKVDKIVRQKDQAASRITDAFDRAREAMERVGKKTNWSDW